MLPLHVFAWQPGMRRAGLKTAALYLIRPDGYVALADPQADPKRLRHYFAERGSSGSTAAKLINPSTSLGRGYVQASSWAGIARSA